MSFLTVKTYPAARTLIRLPLAIPSEHLQMWCMMKHIQTSKGMDQLGLHKLNQEEKSHNCNIYLYISIISKKGQLHDDTMTQYNLRVTLSVVGWCQCSEHSDTIITADLDKSFDLLFNRLMQKVKENLVLIV